MGQKITFIIAPVGCTFHHIPAISQSMKAMFVTEVYRGTCAEDLPKVIGTQPGHHAVFVNTSREALKLIYPAAEIIAYYDACRTAGVSPFHTGTGQLIAPLNHAALKQESDSNLKSAQYAAETNKRVVKTSIRLSEENAWLQEQVAEYSRILDGLPKDAIDGGWTAKGISDYAAKMERRAEAAEAELARLKEKEPVAWMVMAPQGDYVERNPDVIAHLEGCGLAKCKPLYAAAQPSVMHSRQPEEKGQ